MAAFTGQPADAPVLAAIKTAVREYLAGVCADDRTYTYTKVILSSRVLLGRAYEIRMRWLRELESELRDQAGRSVQCGHRRRGAGRTSCCRSWKPVSASPC